MLLQLSIRNFVLVEATSLTVTPGLTVLTGETGAGKSLLLDALGAVLGDKAQPFWVRSGSEKAEVNATFDISSLPLAKHWLALQDLSQEEDECILRRIISADGKSKAFINGTQVTLTQLRQFTEQLVELHSQHEHHALLLPKTQVALLDTWGQHGETLAAVQHAWKHWHQCTQDKQTLLDDAAQRAEKKHLLTFQHQELHPLNLIQGEYEELSQTQHQLSHAQDILMHLTQSAEGIHGDRQSVLTGLDHAIKHLEAVVDIDASLGNILTQCQNAYAELEDAAASLVAHCRHITVDDQKLQEIDARLETYHRLSKKYLVNPEQLWQTAQSVAQQLAEMTTQEADLDRLDQAIEAALQHYTQLANRLSEQRQASAPLLDQAVMSQLQELGMPHAILTWKVTHQPLPQPQGWDTVEVLFSANPGQALHPIAKVASGGELSRVSLAIEVCVADHIQLPVLVFDEIDVGVGGGVADRIGQKLANIAQQKQVLCITHQAQVAAWGDQHWHIQKMTDGQQTNTVIQVLSNTGREEELSRMIGTGEIDETTRQHARQMIRRAHQERGSLAQS